VEPRLLLADFLRHTLGLTGTHVGCEHGVFGACTVLLDSDSVRSCLMFTVQADRRSVETVESLGRIGAMIVQADDPEIAVGRIIELVKTRIPKRFGLDPIRDIQVLCPMNRGGVGARSLNIELQAALNPAGDRKVERFGWIFAPGDKVMQIENDYDKEVYNGDIGYIDAVDPNAGEIAVSFDGRSVTYGFGELDMLVPAYAATIHKSQGSEYPAVVIPVLTQHYAMLQRNLLYTGVTRGKRLVVLVGQKKAVAIAVRNASGRRRWSKLAEWLSGTAPKRG
jgi:exodeoxyribonuclease V alpha subunit